MSDENNPYQAPESSVFDPTGESLNDLAGRGIRLGAAIIDGIVQSIIVFPLLWSLGVWEFLLRGEAMSSAQNLQLGLVGVVVFMLLQGYLLKSRGQTIGKLALGIKIVRLGGAQPEFGALIGLRYLPQWIIQNIPSVGSMLLIVDVLLIFRDDRRCIHDLIAGTQVVRLVES